MKANKIFALLLLTLTAALSACGAAQFGGNNKESEGQDSDIGPAIICVDGDENCVALSCDELYALEAAGKINAGNRSLKECRDRNRGSSGDQEPMSDDSDDDESCD